MIFYYCTWAPFVHYKHTLHCDNSIVVSNRQIRASTSDITSDLRAIGSTHHLLDPFLLATLHLHERAPDRLGQAHYCRTIVTPPTSTPTMLTVLHTFLVVVLLVFGGVWMDRPPAADAFSATTTPRWSSSSSRLSVLETTTTTAASTRRRRSTGSSQLSSQYGGEPEGAAKASPSSISFATTRRESIFLSAATAVASLGMTTVMVPHQAVAATAANDVGNVGTTSTATPVTAKDVLTPLASIPTFCLVDQEGIPFMVFDGQATATGYFFLSSDVAAEALEDARTKDTKTREAQDLWKDAQIVVVPLSVALQLAVSKRQRIGVNTKNKGNVEGVKFNTYNDLVASAEGVADAKAVQQQQQLQDRWSQKGRIPLFYMDGLTIQKSSGEGERKRPLYFNKADLLAEWKKQAAANTGNSSIPAIQVVELVELFRTASSKNDWSAWADLAIMPVAETNQVAREITKQQQQQQKAAGAATTTGNNKRVPYSFDKVFLVNTAKG